FALRFSQTELLGSAHDLLQGLQLVPLLGNEQLRVADDVDKQDMPDLERHFLNLAGHLLKLRENKAIDNCASVPMSRTKLACPNSLFPPPPYCPKDAVRRRPSD